ncbi:MAG: hypothetical protein ACRDPF_34975, partial [Streptosporangiaceae bacterium]
VGRRASGRHRSLRAVVDWSYEQLTPGQQDLFGQLTVFHGSFDAAAASAVADGPGDPAGATRLMLHLADRSLVTAELDGDTTRYRLLETLRGYGLEWLTERGQLGAARARHARWAADLVAQAERGLRGAAEASRRLDPAVGHPPDARRAPGAGGRPGRRGHPLRSSDVS